MWGTSAPTAKNLVATAMPVRPVRSSRAMMDHVMVGFRVLLRLPIPHSSADLARSSMRDLGLVGWVSREAA
jgi:hypothetical protein